MHPCPTLDQLQQLLDESLETETYHAVAHHLEECATCRDALDAMTASTAEVWPPTGTVRSETAAPQAHSRGLYRPLRLHARGGLGEVFEVQDEQFQRPVALKVLHERDGADPDRRRRFLEEARITAQLEHPGIPPVHALALTEDGRPGYAMRFFQGETLHEAVRTFHEAGRSAHVPQTHHLTFRQLLSRFLAVCNTVAYAHSRRLVHGDLKPANIMLAPFGETLVLDWGLARRFADTNEADSSVGRICNPSEPPAGFQIRATEESAPGVVVSQVSGTPSFMSPEQAAGRGTRVGPASDTYSLGATLYFLLTGQPPFPAPQDRHEWQEIAARIRRGDFPRPRAVNPRVPAALEAVCLKAMALRPLDRYADALALAADVEHWLAGEPVSARREPWWQRGGRWLKKHRVVTAAAAAGVFIALVSLAVATAMLRSAYAAEQRARDAADAQRDAADTQRAVADSQRAKADTHLENALQAVGYYLRQLHEMPNVPVPLAGGGTLPPLDGQDARLKRQLQDLTQFYERLQATPDDQDPRFVQLTSYVLHGLGICRAASGNPVQAEKDYLRALDLQERLLAAPHPSNAYAVDLADTACDLFRRYRSWEQPAKARRLFERVDQVFHSLEAEPAAAATLALNMANYLRVFGPPEEGIAWQERLIALLEAAHAREPANIHIRGALQGAVLAHALSCLELHRYAEALPSWNRLGALMGVLSPELRIYRALCLAHTHQHVRAIAEADAVAALPGLSGDNLYQLAAVFAASSGAMREDAQLPPEETERRAERYAAQTLALLNRARAAQFFQAAGPRENLAKDTDFDPLRSRADFRQFVKTLEDQQAGRR